MWSLIPWCCCIQIHSMKHQTCWNNKVFLQKTAGNSILSIYWLEFDRTTKQTWLKDNSVNCFVGVHYFDKVWHSTEADTQSNFELNVLVHRVCNYHKSGFSKHQTQENKKNWLYINCFPPTGWTTSVKNTPTMLSFCFYAGLILINVSWYMAELLPWNNGITCQILSFSSHSEWGLSTCPSFFGVPHK